jgi:cell shape-determining protein MreC
MSHEVFSDDPVEEVQKLEEENRRLREELDLTSPAGHETPRPAKPGVAS